MTNRNEHGDVVELASLLGTPSDSEDLQDEQRRQGVSETTPTAPRGATATTSDTQRDTHTGSDAPSPFHRFLYRWLEKRADAVDEAWRKVGDFSALDLTPEQREQLQANDLKFVVGLEQTLRDTESPETVQSVTDAALRTVTALLKRDEDHRVEARESMKRRCKDTLPIAFGVGTLLLNYLGSVSRIISLYETIADLRAECGNITAPTNASDVQALHVPTGDTSGVLQASLLNETAAEPPIHDEDLTVTLTAASQPVGDRAGGSKDRQRSEKQGQGRPSVYDQLTMLAADALNKPEDFLASIDDESQDMKAALSELISLLDTARSETEES